MSLSCAVERERRIARGEVPLGEAGIFGVTLDSQEPPHIGLYVLDGIRPSLPNNLQQAVEDSLGQLACQLIPKVPMSYPCLVWDGEEVKRYSEVVEGGTQFIFFGDSSTWMSVSRLLEAYGDGIDPPKFENLPPPYRKELKITDPIKTIRRLAEVRRKPLSIARVASLAGSESPVLRLLGQVAWIVCLDHQPSTEKTYGEWLASKEREVRLRQSLISLLASNLQVRGFREMMVFFGRILEELGANTETLWGRVLREAVFLQRITREPGALVEAGVLKDEEFEVKLPTSRQGIFGVDFWLAGKGDDGKDGKEKLMGVRVKKSPRGRKGLRSPHFLLLRSFSETESEEEQRLLGMALRASKKWGFSPGQGLIVEV